jgi:hypothetical protein
MSLWRERGSVETPGRVELSTFPLAELLLPLALLLGMAATLRSGGALLFMAVGFVFFLTAKLSVLLRGIHFSWGSRDMSTGFRACYRLGYVLMSVGAMAAVFSLLLGT